MLLNIPYGFKSGETKESTYLKPKRSYAIFKNETVRGTAVDVDENGSLAVQTENGIIHVTSGEVSVRGIYGYI